MEDSEFSHKKGRVGKVGGSSKKGGITNYPFLKMPFSVCSVSVLLIYAIPISILCVSQKGLSLVESNQQIVTSTNELFLKSKDIVELCKLLYQEVIHLV